MDKVFDFHLLYAVIVFVVIVVAINFFYNRKIESNRNAIYSKYKAVGIAYALLLIVFWLKLPTTPVLSTFGYPESSAEIADPKRLLNLLQDYNRAIVETTEILRWFIFTFVYVFLVGLYQLIKHLKETKAEV